MYGNTLHIQCLITYSIDDYAISQQYVNARGKRPGADYFGQMINTIEIYCSDRFGPRILPGPDHSD